MDAGFSNPLEDKFKLTRMMRGLKKIRGSVMRKVPVTPEHLESAVRYLMAESGYLALGLRTALQLGFFFLLRISEFAAVDEKSKAKWILRRCDVSFFRKGIACGPGDFPDELQLFIRGSKTDPGMQGCYRSQFATGGFLCPVRAMVLWFLVTDKLVDPMDPVFTLPKHGIDEKGKKLSPIRPAVQRRDVVRILKQTALEQGLAPEHVSTHGLRIGGATAMCRAGAHPDMVQILGRWTSDVFKIYTRYHKNMMVGVASAMAGSSKMGPLAAARPEKRIASAA